MNIRTLSFTFLVAILVIFSVQHAFAADSTVPAHDLSIGARGADVTWLQHFLISSEGTSTASASLRSTGATGYFGALTRAALVDFQKTHMITPASGYFGPKTRTVMSGLDTNTSQATTFTGKIEAVNTGCFADATCSVTVDGKKVILQTGMRMGNMPIPTGTLKGVDSIGDLSAKIGLSAHVYAAPLEDGSGYTLVGSSDYYVQVLSAVSITSITPSKGPSGTVVTITGSGFASSSQVGIQNGAMRATSVSADGTKLTFTMQNYVGAYCKVGQVCPMWASVLLSPKTYDLTVINEDGARSNAVQFTLTGTSPAMSS